MTRLRLLDGLRALLAAAVLTALIAGVPLVLYALAGSPLPAHFPGLGEIGYALTHRDDGTLFLALVKAASWAAWASFVASTLIELASRIRGRATPHLPGLGAAQWMSAELISSVALAAGSAALPRHSARQAVSTGSTSFQRASDRSLGYGRCSVIP